jgi:hypothetical protein
MPQEAFRSIRFKCLGFTSYQSNFDRSIGSNAEDGDHARNPHTFYQALMPRFERMPKILSFPLDV